jgi:uncharacterized protein (DUF1778 family)
LVNAFNSNVKIKTIVNSTTVILDQILIAGVSGAVTGGVTAQLQSLTNSDGTQMFPKGSVATSVIAAASGSAAKAILNGRSVGDAIAFAGTNSAITWSLSDATQEIRNTYSEMTQVQNAAQTQADQANNFVKQQNDLVSQYNDTVNTFKQFVADNNIGSTDRMVLVDNKPMTVAQYISDYLQPNLDSINAAYKNNEQSAISVYGGTDTASAYANAVKGINAYNQELSTLNDTFKTQATDFASHVDQAVAGQVVAAVNLATNDVVATQQLTNLTPEQYAKYTELSNNGMDPAAALKGAVGIAATAISTPANAAQDTTQPKPAEPQTQTVQAKYGYDANGDPSVYVINPLTGEKYFPPDVSIGGGPGSLGNGVDTPAPYYYTYGKDQTGAMGFAETTPPADNPTPTDATVPPTDATVPPTDATVPPTDATVPPTDATVPPTGISGKSGDSVIYDNTLSEISGYSGQSSAATPGTSIATSGYSGSGTATSGYGGSGTAVSGY